MAVGDFRDGNCQSLIRMAMQLGVQGWQKMSSIFISFLESRLVLIVTSSDQMLFQLIVSRILNFTQDAVYKVVNVLVANGFININCI